MLRFVPKPFDMAAGLTNTKCTLKDILARIPNLERIYERTFAEGPACWHIDLNHELGGRVQLRLDDPCSYSNREELQALVEKWRGRFPFLRSWCFCESARAWGQSILIFYNCEKPAQGEFSPEYLVEANNGFGAPTRPRKLVSFEALLPCLSGGITIDHARAIQPLNRVAMSEFALHYCGAFLLSSLVRYRPQIWQHALSHSAIEGQATDDRALSLIERFLDIVLGEFPKLVEKTIDWANSRDQQN
jgi:YaaC-like protein